MDQPKATELEVISSYTRGQAIEDGILVNLSHTSEVKEAGFKIPVCVTSALWEKIAPEDNSDIDWHSRLWDVCFLGVTAFRSKKAKGEDCHLVSFKVQFGEDQEPVILWLVFDEAKGFTIMFPEDY